MEHWIIEYRSRQPILTHNCDHARPDDTSAVLRQDIGGGYVRCGRCNDKFLPPYEPGSTHLLLSIRPALEAPVDFASELV